ncbi:hypothetical protein ACQEVB_32630 [Pseudonocardia sp. CA-107938]
MAHPVTAFLRIGGFVVLAAVAVAALARSGIVHRFDPTAPAATRYPAPR